MAAPLTVRREAFFLSDDPEEVLEAIAAPERWSHGAITNAETVSTRTNKPVPGGLLCPRIFGPIEDHACLCGRLVGSEHAGATCERCGVLCDRSSLRAERWGHLHTGAPLFHPASFGRLTAELGCTDRELRILLEAEAVIVDGRVVPEGSIEHDSSHQGPLGLAQRCPEWVVSDVPLPPPTWRATWQDPINRTAAALRHRAYRYDRLVELNAPPIILLNEARMTQRAFESFVRTARREVLAMREAPPPRELPEAVRRLFDAVYDHPGADGPREVLADALADVGDPRGEYITLQLRRTTKRPGRREGALLRRYRSAWLGPLEPAVSRVWFRRGFPAGARTTAEAREQVDLPAWATLEHLETDCLELIDHPRMQALTSITVSLRNWVALSLGEGPLPLVHAEIRAGTQVPRRWPEVADGARFPSLTSLTVSTTVRDPSDWTWIQQAPLAARLHEVRASMPIARLLTAELAGWVQLSRLGPTVSIRYGRNGVLVELGAEAITVHLERGFLERVALGGEELVTGLGAALVPLADRVGRLHLEATEPSWVGSMLTQMTQDLVSAWGDRVVHPPSWLEPQD